MCSQFVFCFYARILASGSRGGPMALKRENLSRAPSYRIESVAAVDVRGGSVAAVDVRGGSVAAVASALVQSTLAGFLK